MKNLKINELESISGGYWKTLWEVGLGLYQRDTETGKYRWIQTQDNLSYTLKVISDGWVKTPAHNYFGGH